MKIEWTVKDWPNQGRSQIGRWTDARGARSIVSQGNSLDPLMLLTNDDPEKWIESTAIFLDQDSAATLWPLLRHFAETGRLPEPPQTTR